MTHLERPTHLAQRQGEACATCGMDLPLPGIPYEGRRYCCHGCVPRRERSERRAGALRPPTWGRSVEVRRAVFIAEDPEEVGRFLADIDLLHLYEQKLARIQITGIGQHEKTACATADGHFGPVLFHIELHFDAADGGGYESTLCSGGPILGLRGSFKVHPAEGGCVVTHVERYQFASGPIAWWLGQLWKPYIGWSMARELRTLKRLVEEPGALAEAARMRDPRLIPVDSRVVIWDPTRENSAHRGLLAKVPTSQTVAVLGAFASGLLLRGGAFALGQCSGSRRAPLRWLLRRGRTW